MFRRREVLPRRDSAGTACLALEREEPLERGEALEPLEREEPTPMPPWENLAVSPPVPLPPPSAMKPWSPSAGAAPVLGHWRGIFLLGELLR